MAEVENNEQPVYYLESILLGYYYISPLTNVYYFRSVKDLHRTYCTFSFSQMEKKLIDRYYNRLRCE